jgi:hypothetical protein
MFDMRYHIASLVAVFLALSVGILVGTSIVNKGVLVQQQQKLVKSIDNSIENVKEKNKTLSSQASSHKEFEDSVFNYWSKGRLANRKIAVIVFESDNDRQQEIKAVSWLQGAGATAATISIKDSYFFNNDDNGIKSMAKFYPGLSEKKLKNTVINSLLEEMAGLSKPVIFSDLVSKNVINTDDKEIIPCDGIVIVAGPSAKSKAESIEKTIAVNASTMVKTAIVESSTVNPTGLNLFINERLSTVDNIDYGSGGISLVNLLINKKGNFGIKKEAEKVTPLE